jgi:hypothetical protein
VFPELLLLVIAARCCAAATPATDCSNCGASRRCGRPARRRGARPDVRQLRRSRTRRRARAQQAQRRLHLALQSARLYPLVDDKLKTKRWRCRRASPCRAVRRHRDAARHPHAAGHRAQSQRIRAQAAHGSAGDGIVVIAGRSGNRYRTIGGEILDEDFLSHHLSNAINGQFSLGGVQDVVIVEYIGAVLAAVRAHQLPGRPDIRVIVFRGIPIMSMVRLPTRGSRGKANCIRAPVGAGIDLATGITLDGVIAPRW